MGPITLFDKSFLQSLSLDESVWFDHFFLTTVCPIFYIETLSDLEKSVRKGRTPEEEVRIIANKFPEMHGTPCAHHLDLCIGNLMGNPVSMTGQIPVAGGHLVKVDGKTGSVFQKAPESEAFSRWQKQEFKTVERLYASVWRQSLSSIDLEAVAKGFRKLGIDHSTCTSLEEAKIIADSMVHDKEQPFDRMVLAMTFLNIPIHMRSGILERWNIANYSPLYTYSPYVAFVLTIEVFFKVALAANLISSERASNRTDIAYLFYLPFCMMFVSSDKLHKRSAPLFLQKNQSFVWGPDLKAGLQRINEHYSELPEKEKENGVKSFAGAPPLKDDIVFQLWDRHLPNWSKDDDTTGPFKPRKDTFFAKEISKYSEAPPLKPEEIDFDPHNTDSMAIERSYRRRKGSWWQIPKDLKISDDK